MIGDPARATIENSKRFHGLVVVAVFVRIQQLLWRNSQEFSRILERCEDGGMCGTLTPALSQRARELSNVGRLICQARYRDANSLVTDAAAERFVDGF